MIAQHGLKNYALVTVMLVMAACASDPMRPAASQAASVGDRAVAVALEQVGTPYRYGGNTPRGFDCSGLIHYAYHQAGLSVPRTTGQLWSATATVGKRQLQAGDLLFFSIAGKMSHVGMYVGGKRFVHAPQSGRTVEVTSMDKPFYREALGRAGRLY
ncbi:MAG: C40 family peptidase [Woeseiaceae bacterium]